MKSTPRVTFDIPRMAIKHMWGSQKILGFIDTEGGICNEPGILYLSRHIENHYNVSILPVLHIHTIVRYFSACNTIYNHNRIIQSNLALRNIGSPRVAILDFQIQLNWVWVFQIGSSYSVMEFQSKLKTMTF